MIFLFIGCSIIIEGVIFDFKVDGIAYASALFSLSSCLFVTIKMYYNRI